MPSFDFYCPQSKWTRAISKMIPCVFLTSLIIGYNFTWIIVWAKLFTGKLGSHKNLIFYPTLDLNMLKTPLKPLKTFLHP